MAFKPLFSRSDHIVLLSFFILLNALLAQTTHGASTLEAQISPHSVKIPKEPLRKIQIDALVYLVGYLAKLSGKDNTAPFMKATTDNMTQVALKQFHETVTPEWSSHLVHEGATNAAKSGIKTTATSAKEPTGTTFILAATGVTLGVIASIIGVGKWLHCTALLAHDRVDQLEKKIYRTLQTKSKPTVPRLESISRAH